MSLVQYLMRMACNLLGREQPLLHFCLPGIRFKQGGIVFQTRVSRFDLMHELLQIFRSLGVSWPLSTVGRNVCYLLLLLTVLPLLLLLFMCHSSASHPSQENLRCAVISSTHIPLPALFSVYVLSVSRSRNSGGFFLKYEIALLTLLLVFSCFYNIRAMSMLR
jgi:hypothetical protein